ncbi:hypothetical protein CDAR_104171 [Caerostris darwini]|uniref:Uncharacterized protein n=1 Tax=Caerostris darwini TaxID=1538125 RepID=A0AAV4RZE5_9ARAC|nr:hypothetical protein CDAR_104171 [Caerostris darwini]
MASKRRSQYGLLDFCDNPEFQSQVTEKYSDDLDHHLRITCLTFTNLQLTSKQGTEGHLLSPGDSGMSSSDVGRLEPGLTEMPTFESHPNT